MVACEQGWGRVESEGVITKAHEDTLWKILIIFNEVTVLHRC